MLAIIDSANACIRGITLAPGGDEPAAVTTLAGACGGFGFADGPGDEALFGGGMQSLVCLPNCSLLVGDLGSGRLRCAWLGPQGLHAALAAEPQAMEYRERRQGVTLVTLPAGVHALPRLFRGKSVRKRAGSCTHSLPVETRFFHCCLLSLQAGRHQRPWVPFREAAPLPAPQLDPGWPLWPGASWHCCTGSRALGRCGAAAHPRAAGHPCCRVRDPTGGGALRLLSFPAAVADGRGHVCMHSAHP